MANHRSRSSGPKYVTKKQNIALLRKLLNNPSIASIDILLYSEKQLLKKYQKEFNLLFTEFREKYPEHESRTDIFLLKALRNTVRRDKLAYDREKMVNGGIIVTPTGNKRLDLLIPLFRQFDNSENEVENENEVIQRKNRSVNKMNIENENTIENGVEESVPTVEKSLSIESVDITQQDAMNIENEKDTLVLNQETNQRNILEQDEETESDYELEKENENDSEYELESDNDIETEMMIENEKQKVVNDKVNERHRVLNEKEKEVVNEREQEKEKEVVNERDHEKEVVHEKEKEVLHENETNGMNDRENIRMNDNERERNIIRENDHDSIRMNDNERERNIIRENDHNRENIRMNESERERNIIRENDHDSIRMNDNTSVYGKDMEFGNSSQQFIDFTSMNRPDTTFTQFLDFLKEDKKRESDSQMQILMNLLKMVNENRAYDARFSLIESKIEGLQQKIDKLMDLLQQQNTNNAKE